LSDALAFIRAIHAAPDDAAPRLVCADWLDEHSEPGRADLIRRMCLVPTYVFTWSGTARHGRHVHAERVGAIRGLKGRVETVYRDEWLHLPGVELIQVCRGLIESIDIRPQPFLAHAAEIFARHPVVAVRLCGLHTWLSATRRASTRASCSRAGPTIGTGRWNCSPSTRPALPSSTPTTNY
jgi:uncharacterized protein (TIGR02996 family)